MLYSETPALESPIASLFLTSSPVNRLSEASNRSSLVVGIAVCSWRICSNNTSAWAVTSSIVVEWKWRCGPGWNSVWSHPSKKWKIDEFFFPANSFAGCKVVSQSVQACLPTTQPAAVEALWGLSAWILWCTRTGFGHYYGQVAVHWLVPWMLPMPGVSEWWRKTFCGCLLLAAVADLCACSKMPSWFSVFTDCSDMISICWRKWLQSFSLWWTCSWVP